MGLSVAIAGASGYAGGELLRLVLGHPALELAVAAAGAHAGAPITRVHPQLPQLGDRTFAPTEAAALGADVVFMALPHGESAGLADELPEASVVVDLGADFRLADPAAWERYYGGRHAGVWTYGLPELPGARAAIADSTRVANPGCYATAVTLALAPLLDAELVETDDVVAVAASGTSGAGRTAKQHLLGAEVMGDLSAYKVTTHQHVPEIAQALGIDTLSFTPVLAPMPRGILATCTARVTAGVTHSDLRAALATAYAAEPFVHLLPEGNWPHTAATTGANSCQLQVALDVQAGRAVVVSALDNLGKGAAGQAVQNANIALGLPETAGLSAAGVAP